jgi:ribonuclease D
LPTYFAHDALPEANEPLQERIRKAGPYFHSLLTDDLLPLIQRCPTDSDNKQVRDSLLEVMDELEKELFSKSRCFAGLTDGFDALAYLQTRNLAELDFRPERRKAEASQLANDSRSNGLYGALTKWRNDKAGEHGASAYMVLPQKTLVELARVRPTTSAELITIKGFGKTKVKQIGHEVLAIIQEYVGGGPIGRSGLSEGKKAAPKAKKEKDPKGVSPIVTLALFKSGKTIDQIAEERGLAVSTIESHLAQAISSGELAIDALLPRAKVSAIRTYLTEHTTQTLSEARQGLGNDVTYSEIRFVYNAMRAEETF